MIPLSSPDITEAEIAAVASVMRSGRLSLGPELAAFEQALARAHHTPDAVAVSSGTAALHLALVALDIGPGDEVIVPSFTFVAVANAVAHVGATPVFAEIDAVTLNLDPAAAEQAITSRTRAIIVVHTFGIPAKMDAFADLARRHGLLLIEDACEAIGASFGGRPVGSFGALTALGFYPNKQITTGEGGALLVHDEQLATRLRRLRNQGRDAGAGWLDHAEIGYNYRLSEIACALGRVQLERLDEILQARAQAAACYSDLLSNLAGLELPPVQVQNRILSWFVYVVRLPVGVDCEHAASVLNARGIATGRYFPPIHRQPAWYSRRCSQVLLSVTEAISKRTLALPFFTRITREQQERVATALAAALD
ncbi:MAG: DegT/DnrJ/EryC1/StrS family aminotransferase [Terracidiphilus sp.]|nr:DegT/DnrJ/EryC1/StrS family aminotransferase [Terracidiphilus sp.]